MRFTEYDGIRPRKLKLRYIIGLILLIPIIFKFSFDYGLKSTYSPSIDYSSEAGPSSFKMMYKVDSATKYSDYRGDPEAAIVLKTDDERLSSYDGKEIDLHVSQGLANGIKPGDSVRVTIELVDPEIK
jgi:hypothetical protein